jgi:hypothetical protein
MSVSLISLKAAHRALVAGLALAIAGCASTQSPAPSASPGMTAQRECERRGGVWRAALNICEFLSPGLPQ